MKLFLSIAIVTLLTISAMAQQTHQTFKTCDELSYLLALPEGYSADVPVSGGGDPLSAYRIKDIPCQVFHGKKDQAVSEQRSAEMVEALKKLGADVKYTVLPEGDHPASWIYAYNEADLWSWLLSNKKK